MKIEIGGQRNMPGWTEYNNRDSEPGENFNIVTDEFNLPNNSVEYFYMSHVIEHIPIVCAERVLTKFYKKLKPGGKLRIVCPDLEILLKAYFDKDYSIFNNPNYQTGTVPESYKVLGIGGYFMAQITTGGFDENDSYLFTAKKNGKYICTFSHIAGWDYDMLHNLLKHIGFKNIEKTGIEDIDPHKTSGQLCVNAYK